MLPVALLATALALLSWPVATVGPRTDIDASWEGALHLAWLQGLDHGRDVVFTHGPLGFLVSPLLWSRPTGVAAWLVVLAAQVAFCGALLVLLRRWLPLGLAAVAVAVLTLVTVRPAADLLALVGLVAALVVLQSPDRPRRPRRAWALAVVATVLLGLVKVSAGLYLAVVLAVLVVALPAGGRSRGGQVLAAVGRLAVTGAAGLGVLAVVWVALGQAPGALAAWLRGAVELTLGYADGMALEEPGRAWEYAAAGALAAGLALLLAVGRREPDAPAWRSSRGLALLVLLLATAWLEAKRGFVVHNRHSLGLFLFLVTVPLTVRWRGAATRGAALLLSVAAVVAAARAGDVPLGPGTPGRALAAAARAVDQAQVLASAERTREVVAGARREAVATADLPPAVLAALRGRTVHVTPYDTYVVWAHGLAWRPLPVLQSYSAYTPWLDGADAAVLAGDDAPEALLRARVPSFRRDPALDAPRATLVQACRYDEAVLAERWQVLLRGEDRCGSERVLTRVRVAPAEPVAVPPPGDPGSLVVARLAVPTTPLRRLAGAALKAPTPVLVLDGRREPLVEGHGPAPYLLRVPPDTAAGPGPGGPRDVRTLALLGVPGPVEIVFAEVPLVADVPRP